MWVPIAAETSAWVGWNAAAWGCKGLELRPACRRSKCCTVAHSIGWYFQLPNPYIGQYNNSYESDGNKYLNYELEQLKKARIISKIVEGSPIGIKKIRIINWNVFNFLGKFYLRQSTNQEAAIFGSSRSTKRFSLWQIGNWVWASLEKLLQSYDEKFLMCEEDNNTPNLPLLLHWLN